MKVAIIGTGNLGKSIAKGLITNNAITSLYLNRRNVASLHEFEGYKNVYLTSDTIDAVKHSDILIIAVQPSHLEGILKSIKPYLTEYHVILSTVTGFVIPKIEAILGADHYIVRAMPNTAIAVGKSMTCLCSNEKGKARIKIAEAIFRRLGNTLVIPETQMQAATVICASGIAFWMRLILRNQPHQT